MGLLASLLPPPQPRGRAAVGLWILRLSCAFIAACWAPLAVGIVVLPRDANPIGLGLLAVFGSGLGLAGVIGGAVIACLSPAAPAGRRRGR